LSWAAAGTPSRNREATPTPAAGADVAFIDGMVPHHRTAIEAARRVLPSFQNAQLRQIAENIVSSQAQEIQAMERIRKELSG
jgi:uncharacterized protein (DUF305 family)